MEKRKIILGTYDTAVHGWTLTGWQLGPAEQKTKYIDKPNGDGAWDISTAISDGVLRYNNRPFTATLECSEGTRQEREATIRHLINTYDGMVEDIHLPDDEYHHVSGRLHIAREYNDLAHAAVTVTAVCEPWKYANAETSVTVTATEEAQHVTLQNAGRRAMVPEIKVTGGSVLLTYKNTSQELNAGTYQWPNLLLTPGDHALMYRGTGTITVTYREAVLE
jgi:hypothetical protein